MSTLLVSRKGINHPNRLRVLRAERRLSQMDVAAHLGCGHNRYWRIENGFQVPTDDEERQLAKLFNTSIKGVFPVRAA